jgi:hypothetical protein
MPAAERAEPSKIQKKQKKTKINYNYKKTSHNSLMNEDILSLRNYKEL